MTDEIISTTSPGAYEQTSGQSVSRAHVIVDSDGDKEALTLDARAGASSEAPANSGIPSAERQQRGSGEMMTEKEETPIADRVLSLDQDSKP